jgi:anaerobic selenocysteine-containing dehydrogenase
VLPRLADAPWDLAPPALVDQLAAMTDPPALTLIPRRMPKRFNGRALGNDAPEVLVHPDDARAAGITDGDVVSVESETGRLRLPARVTDAIPAGVVSISHGWTDANVNVLISSHDLDPLTGMPRSSGTAVSLQRECAD